METHKIKNPPKLRIRRDVKVATVPGYNPERAYSFHYENKTHRELPHVAKFSGGRSSGMLLVALLSSGALKAERGDVVVFNNTSAEHPATYDFVSKCKHMTENEYGIPFFWTEFQTYEDVVGGEWTRQPSYRLVNDRPLSPKNPDGYRQSGEVFEELLSWKRFIPNQYERTCTNTMKLFVTKEFLSDWFAVKTATDRLGHYREKTMIDKETLAITHKKNGGKTPVDILAEKMEYVLSRPPHRPEQKFSDFSAVADAKKIKNKHLHGKSFGDRVRLSGDKCAEYISFVGFRADEPRRVAKMLERNRSDVGEPQPQETVKPPEGEHVYAPLAMMGVCRENIVDFWQAQNWDLRLPHEQNFSNCVFCFLKGAGNIVNIARETNKMEKKLPKKLRGAPDSPADIKWWVKMENKYGRDLVRENRNIRNPDKPFIGFFGMGNRTSFSLLAETAKGNKSALSAPLDSLPCDCTD